MKSLKVGLTFNMKRAAGDDDAEYDSPETIEGIKKTIESLGHTVVPWEAVPDLVRVMNGTRVDVVFNMAEGLYGRNREAHVPALLEFLGIPFTGSDSATMMLTLDKALTKKIVRFAGVNTPNYKLLRGPGDKLRAGMQFPLMVKPNAEGSSKGIGDDSVVHDMDAMWKKARYINERYRQPALVEEFLPGREFTVGILGNGEDLRILPIMEVEFLDKANPFNTYNYRIKQDWTKYVRYNIPAQIEAPLKTEIEELCLKTYRHLMCRDVSRIDVRLDAQGKPHLIELNPLPGLSWGYSDLCFIAEAAGMTHADLIGAILENALKRCGLR
jgi:D-alanine-D-alanine ligase